MRATAALATMGTAAWSAALLVGCGSQASAPATGSPAAPASTASSTSSAPVMPSAATPGATVPAGWKSSTSADGSLTFNYPGTWTVKTAPAGATGAAVEVLTDYGRTIASLRTGLVTGAECTAKMPFMQYDSAPVPALVQKGVAPRFVYEARTDPTAGDPAKQTTFAFGLTSAPEPTGTEACPMAHFFNWPPSGASFGGVYDPFDTTPGKPMHVDTPEAYKDTAEYQNGKQMIMSLRPAGK